MSTEHNKAAFTAINDIFNTGDLSGVTDLIAENYTEHDRPPGIVDGLAGFKQLVEMYRSAFPDLRSRTEQVVAEGDLVAGRIVTTGTHAGALMRIAPTGKNIDIQEFHIVRFANGQCVEHWGVVDLMTMMHQLGVGSTQPL